MRSTTKRQAHRLDVNQMRGKCRSNERPPLPTKQMGTNEILHRGTGYELSTRATSTKEGIRLNL